MQKVCMELFNFFLKKSDNEGEGDILINKFESKYLLFQREYPNDNPHIILKKVFLAIIKELGVDINNEDIDMMAWSETSAFVSIPPPLNARALGLYVLYKSRPDIIGKNPKFELEFQKLMELSKFNPSDKEYFEIAKSYFNDKSTDKEVEIKIMESVHEFFREDTELYFDKGQNKLKLGDFKGAIIDFTSAIVLNPNHSGIYCGRGLAKYQLSDFQSAKKDFDKAIELNPNYAEAYRYRAASKSNLGDIKGSINDYTKAIEIEPKDFESYFNRGLTKVALKEHTLALKDFSEAVELNPRFADAFYLKGLMYWILGNNHEAFLNLSKASELGNSDAKEMLKKF